MAGKRIYVAGHRGMVGSGLVRRLDREDCEVLTASRQQVDLLSQAAVHDYLASEQPDAVVVAAAKVGGIHANDTYPAEFLYENLMIEANLIHGAHIAGIDRVLFLGSSCIYPRMAPQPMPEDCLLTGPLEATNEWYAVAKIAGIKLCQAYRKQYDLANSHVLPALLRKAHEARLAGDTTLAVWGSGKPRREFMHVDDLSDALIYLLETYSGEEHVNVGVGIDVSIRELAETVCKAVGLEAELVFDPAKPDGTPRKLMDVSRLTAMGWTAKIGLEEGIGQTYDWFRGSLAAGADVRQ
ncbi:MAG: GDP-L-fucose synthase [Rhodospirillales bacterium]|nr:GDP-L-fucose synthase [Rhodospirillales bacterium]